MNTVKNVSIRKKCESAKNKPYNNVYTLLDFLTRMSIFNLACTLNVQSVVRGIAPQIARAAQAATLCSATSSRIIGKRMMSSLRGRVLRSLCKARSNSRTRCRMSGYSQELPEFYLWEKETTYTFWNSQGRAELEGVANRDRRRTFDG